MEWNLNTLVSLAGLAAMSIGLVTVWVDKGRDIQELQGWRADHEQYHKERLADVRASDATNATRLSVLDNRVNESERKIDQLTYRITVGEQSTINISKSIENLQATVNQQTTDLQVVREILQRMEGRTSSKARTP